MAVYEYMSPPTLTPAMSNRACNALALFQCIASHPKTRNDLVECRIPVFLYPFLRGNSSETSSEKVDKTSSSSQSSKTTTMQQPLDFLRLTSLGVIGALVKAEDERGTKFLLQNDYMPMGLNIIEHGNELTKIVSTFILLRILSTPEGLIHCCHTYERFSHVAFILGKVVAKLGDDIESGNGDPKQQCKLLNKIIRCYVRLCDNEKALKALNECLPDRLKSDFFNKILKTTAGDDHITEQLLTRLRHIIAGHVKQTGDK
jgi:CCR4-NOT transcription complex subunit 9